jgi:hypothetical protein
MTSSRIQGINIQNTKMNKRDKSLTNWQKVCYWLYTMLGFRAFERRQLAKKILIALLQNPERYKYIASQVESEKLKQEDANNKNINKAYKIADSFVRWQYEA